jgi:uncharacterized membrane-anchored protein
MRVNRLAVCALFLLALVVAPAWAQDERELFRNLKSQSGAITLRDGLATLNVGPNFSYLSPADAEIFLTKIWRNPPGVGERTLGLLLPNEIDMLGSEGWAIVIQYDESGYVSDEDAGKIDYGELLKEMQEATATASKEREEQGFGSMSLVGWAKQPYYDPGSHKLYWAKRLRFGDSQDDTLNYNIRALGRRGVLVLNAVSSMDQLSTVDRRLPEILAMVSFNQGNTYSEYTPGVDKTAAYTLAGLIAGGVLAKAGFFKVLLVGLAAFWKVIAVGGVAAVAAIGSFVKRLTRRDTPPMG